MLLPTLNSQSHFVVVQSLAALLLCGQTAAAGLCRPTGGETSVAAHRHSASQTHHCRTSDLTRHRQITATRFHRSRTDNESIATGRGPRRCRCRRRCRFLFLRCRTAALSSWRSVSSRAFSCTSARGGSVRRRGCVRVSECGRCRSVCVGRCGAQSPVVPLRRTAAAHAQRCRCGATGFDDATGTAAAPSASVTPATARGLPPCCCARGRTGAGQSGRCSASWSRNRCRNRGLPCSACSSRSSCQRCEWRGEPDAIECCGGPVVTRRCRRDHGPGGHHLHHSSLPRVYARS